jgi:hypothetical protein
LVACSRALAALALCALFFSFRQSSPLFAALTVLRFTASTCFSNASGFNLAFACHRDD